MAFRRRHANTALTGDNLVLLVQKRSLVKPFLLLLFCLMLGAAGLYAHFNKDLLVAILQAPRLIEENKVLRDALEQARLNQEIEVITRQELERQITTLTEQLKEDKAELEFFRSASGTDTDKP